MRQKQKLFGIEFLDQFLLPGIQGLPTGEHRQKQKTKNSPIYRVNIDNLNTNFAVKALVCKINVRCTDFGYTWVGKHREKETQRDNCLFMLMQCPNGCIGSQQRTALDQHLAACPINACSACVAMWQC